MKTTVDLPDDLVRAIKIRAAREDRKLKDLVAELLRRALEAPPDAQASKPRRPAPSVFPIFRGGHPAPPGQEMTAERVAEILLDDEVEHLIR